MTDQTSEFVRPLTRCSSQGCTAPAVEVLVLRDQPGHVHDCAQHAHDVREWCDVVKSFPIVGGACTVISCTEKPIWTGQPTPLEPPGLHGQDGAR